jgi:hypothetical protein
VISHWKNRVFSIPNENGSVQALRCFDRRGQQKLLTEVAHKGTQAQKNANPRTSSLHPQMQHFTSSIKDALIENSPRIFRLLQISKLRRCLLESKRPMLYLHSWRNPYPLVGRLVKQNYIHQQDSPPISQFTKSHIRLYLHSR